MHVTIDDGLSGNVRARRLCHGVCRGAGFASRPTRLMQQRANEILKLPPEKVRRRGVLAIRPLCAFRIAFAARVRNVQGARHRVCQPSGASRYQHAGRKARFYSNAQ